jgi:uncharacterized lipoprotein YehR (DUF1307 family)
MKNESEVGIPSIKYTTKEEIKAALDKKEADYTELQQRYYQLDYIKDQLQERLYATGVDQRNTIMSQIVKREAQARDSINYIIMECEKETGREFSYCFCACKDEI